MPNNTKFWRQNLYWLAAISFIVRAFLASNLNLGNDEVYYRLYALFPDWSHFDHPLMVGLAIQFFSFDLLLDSELFLRMSSLVLGTVNLFIVFNIGKYLRNSRTGFYSALLYTASIYSFVITGIFILPDTPQQFFWLLSLSVMIKILPACPNIKSNGIKMIWLGVLIGFGIISKYTSVFLWLGAGFFILFFNRQWLSKKWLYLSILSTIIISLPIVIWNIQNDFISFTFHGDRVDMAGYSFNIDYLLTELLGELLYNNPVNYILIIISVFLAFRRKLDIKKEHQQVILFASLPLIFLFVGFSFFRSTLPHWTSPGVSCLIFLSAVWMDQITPVKNNNIFGPWPIKIAVSLLAVILVLGFLQVNYGIVKLDSNGNYYDLGSEDPSLDMIGYDKIGEEFAILVENDRRNNIMKEGTFLAGQNWFPLANFDYYAASPLGMKSFAFGSLNKIHKYAWINEISGGIKLGDDAYYITDSREFHEPSEYFNDYFENIEIADTIQISRGGVIAKRAFIFRLKNLKRIPESALNRN
jgi:hypothetical protein